MRRPLSFILALLCFNACALGVRVADITRLGGQRTNVLTGMGLVFGLKGTGDGGDYLPAIRPLAQMLGKFSNAATLEELADAKNVAIVMITAKVPAAGARDGDVIDVYVTSIGGASSLRGGRLFVTPLLGPTGQLTADGMPFALAEGQIILEDSATPTVGVVRRGGVMEIDLPAEVVENDRFTLVIDDPSASWQMSNLIASVVNNDEYVGENIAVALDAKNVVVTIPRAERARPDAFIARILRLQLPMVPVEARVTINERTGTMILTGDVEISPVVISHKGLTISTIRPEPIASPTRPIQKQMDFVAVDPNKSGGAKLQDLLDALDQLKVPAEDRISIIKELHRSGKVHAKLIIE
jgi:flagellar P-ring protein FlgI